MLVMVAASGSWPLYAFVTGEHRSDSPGADGGDDGDRDQDDPEDATPSARGAQVP